MQQLQVLDGLLGAAAVEAGLDEGAVAVGAQQRHGRAGRRRRRLAQHRQPAVQLPRPQRGVEADQVPLHVQAALPRLLVRGPPVVARGSWWGSAACPPLYRCTWHALTTPAGCSTSLLQHMGLQAECQAARQSRRRHACCCRSAEWIAGDGCAAHRPHA